MNEGAASRIEQLGATGRWAAAEELARVALTEHPGDPDILVALAYVLMLAERFAEGLAAAQAAAAAAPQDERPHRMAALLLSSLGRHHEATFAGYHAVGLAPGEPAAALAYALVLQRAGRLADAEQVARRAVELAPARPDAHARLAQIAAERGDVRTARAAYTEALRLDPDDAAARHNLALLDLRRNRAGAALRGLITAGRMDPTLTPVLANVGAVLWRLVTRLRIADVVVTVLLLGAQESGDALARRIGAASAVLATAAVVAWQLRRLPPEGTRAVRAAVRADVLLALTVGGLAACTLLFLATAATGAAAPLPVAFLVLVVLFLLGLARRLRPRSW